MSAVNPISNNPPVNPASSSSGAAPGSAVQTSMSQGIKSFQALQKIAPKVANAMMQAIAQTTINQMNNSMDRIHKSNQEAKYFQNG